MKKNLPFFAAILLLFIGISCTKDEPTLNNTVDLAILYSNSFENAADTTGWAGYCGVYFTENTPQNGGNRSVAISCGCIAPYVNFEIGPFDEDNLVVISCMARGFDLGGNLSLTYEDNVIGFAVPSDSTWQYFESVDTLFVPENELIKLGIFAGGLASGLIEVDLLEVRTVE